MVTAGTYLKHPYFSGPERLSFLHDLLQSLSILYGWELQAWAVMANHYHFLALSAKECRSLTSLVQHLHSQSARWVNRLDDSPGRRVWFQYWDTAITAQRAYYARLRYVHFNPVHHGLVARAQDYRWCSAHSFGSPAQTAPLNPGDDTLRIPDDY